MIYGYGFGLLNPQEKTLEKPLHVSLQRAKRVPQRFKQECAETARLIATKAQKLNRTPTLCLSGGRDSQLVALILKGADVEFNAVTVRFELGFNAADVREAQKFAEANNIRHSIINLNVIDTVRAEEGTQQLEKYFCSRPLRLAEHRLIQHIWKQGGFPIGGDGSTLLKKRADCWALAIDEQDCLLDYFCAINKIETAYSFFDHTPELLLSFLLEPEIQELGIGANKLANKVLTTSLVPKYNMYRKLWGVNQPTKLDVSPVLRRHLSDASRCIGRYDDTFYIPYETCLEQLAP